MKILHIGTLLSVSVLLGGCLYGQCMNGPFALERAKMIKAIKAYGEYWVKPDMTNERWQADWVTCGGMKDGGYASDAPSGSPTVVLINASKQKRQDLGTCMQSKGYEYQIESKSPG